MSPAGPRKYERETVLRTGIAHYVPHEEMGQVSQYRLQLDWIPVSLKNRSRSMYNKTLGRIMHFRDSKVQTDLDAIRAIWTRLKGTLSHHPPVCPLRMEVHVTINRPLSKNEATTGIWNRRRGDPCSAHELIMDALEGCWYENDAQVTRIVIEENRACVVPSVLIIGFPR